jgi:hypothetical protein
MNWETALQREGARWRAAASNGSPDIDRMLSATMSRLEREGLQPDEALALLSHLLEPLCGRAAAESAMAMASRECGGVTGRTWRAFVASLSKLIGSFCGMAAGRLIGQAGLSLEVA